MSELTLSSYLQHFPRLAVLGTDWGDEGKGKIAHILSKFYDLVAKFGGGNNAGHTVFSESGREFGLHYLSGRYLEGMDCVLGRGVLVNIAALAEEMNGVRPYLQGNPQLFIDEGCPLWTPYHALLEQIIAQQRTGESIGSTGKAIGPMAALHALRMGPVAGDLRDIRKLRDAIWEVFRFVEPYLSNEQMEFPEELPEQMIDAAGTCGLRLGNIIDTGAKLFDAIVEDNQRILFEGTQATGLSLDAGTYPFVSSTSTIAAGALTGTLLPPGAISGSLMVRKLFPTRVGGGPFPSEIWYRGPIQKFADDQKQLFSGEGCDEQARARFLDSTLSDANAALLRNHVPHDLARYIMVLANELGVTTGRGRSPGLPDLEFGRYAVRINDPIGFALNGLDLASGLEKIPVVVAYEIGGERIKPRNVPMQQLAQVKPVIELWDGWKEDIAGVQEWEDLPQAARDFVQRYEAGLGRSVLLIGTGPSSQDIIFRHEPNEHSQRFFM